MEKQRHAQRVLNDHTSTTCPTLITPHAIETHASKIYTRTMFLKVQREIYKGSWSCSQTSVTKDGGNEVYLIKHSDKPCQDHLQFTVVRNVESGSIKCSCNQFGRHGYLCRHIFCVFKNKNVQEIPKEYISKRWRRDVLPRHLLHDKHRYGRRNDEADKIATEAFENLELCFSKLRNNPEKLSDFVSKLNKLTEDTLADLPNISGKEDKEVVYQELLGVTEPEELTILPPTPAKNKGSGTHTGKRLVNPGEKHVKKRKRQMRECKWCHEVQDKHDSRNFPDRLAKLEAESASKRAKLAVDKAANQSATQARKEALQEQPPQRAD
uniref:protein FAR1-RELATED SEQUENCE 5-like n=1 Tax=Erigeron canadensis TaxID=72917 RepID=UPI001CB8B353|nr:protein FAR1-RELATED SEQUENCE 5-like [Erigeron canadensis]